MGDVDVEADQPIADSSGSALRIQPLFRNVGGHRPAIAIGGLEIEFRRVCDSALSLFDERRYHDGMDLMFRQLTALRNRACADEWRDLCRVGVRELPIASIIHEDPITRHSFRKPRGYPGDAGLLDLIYSSAEIPVECTDVGGKVWRYTVNAPEAVAVRERRDLLARLIDQVSDACESPRILSIACGHVRELNLSAAVRNDRFTETGGGTFLGLDQDPMAVAEVQRALGRRGIRVVIGSVKSLLQKKLDGMGYHLIYAAGLYDYLSDALAGRLTARLFDMLTPGGQLLVANFAPGGFGTGYVETFMDWHLIYRDQEQLERLAAGIEPSRIRCKQLFSGENRHVAYMRLTRG